MSDEPKGPPDDLSGATLVLPPKEPKLPSGFDRFKLAAEMLERDPLGMLLTTYLLFHDLLEVLIKNEGLKLSDLENVKQGAYREMLADAAKHRGKLKL